MVTNSFLGFNGVMIGYTIAPIRVMYYSSVRLPLCCGTVKANASSILGNGFVIEDPMFVISSLGNAESLIHGELYLRAAAWGDLTKLRGREPWISGKQNIQMQATCHLVLFPPCLVTVIAPEPAACPFTRLMKSPIQKTLGIFMACHV
jgi:hypothetical protein